jgi:smad nuclear-interacting protein 1
MSTSRNRERSPRHRIREEHSPKSRRDGDSESRFSKGDLERQVTTKKSGPLPSQAASFLISKDPSTALVGTEDKPVQERQKPNFAPTGLLAAASNTIAHADGTSIILKYHEPPEARKPPPKDQWKLFVFKGSDILDTIELSLRSCWLVGRELAVVDLAAEHPSTSKQHAVIQFRWIEKRNEFGDKLGRVRPYLIDLESANGTKLNKELIPSSRYLELRDKDMIQFGDSTREYVLMLPPKD